MLALAVTIIEVSLTLAGGPETTALARDIVFAAVMIILAPAASVHKTRTRLPLGESSRPKRLLLLACLGIVVLLAKALSRAIEAGVASVGAPKSLVGYCRSSTVVRSAGSLADRYNRLQTSLNLALSSALTSIGLTIPAVSILPFFTGHDYARY